MSKRSCMMTALLFVITVAVGFAQQPPQKPKPDPEHKKLEYFVGNWTSEGDMKASPFGPAGKFTGRDSCEWFTGGFHVVCRNEGKGPMGDLKGLGILGYNSDDRVYTYYGIDNMGMGEVSKGTVQGKVWNWEGESKMGGKAMKSRYTITEISPTSYTFKWDMSVDNGPWSTVLEGKTTKAVKGT